MGLPGTSAPCRDTVSAIRLFVFDEQTLTRCERFVKYSFCDKLQNFKTTLYFGSFKALHKFRFSPFFENQITFFGFSRYETTVFYDLNQ